MKNLEKYIEQQNRFAVAFKSKAYDVSNLSKEDIKEIASRLSADLSPENLTCDGELPASQVQAKAKFLNAVRVELEKLGGVVEY